MSVLLINLNDTLVSGDTIIAQAAKSVQTVAPVYKGTESSCSDVVIAAIVCVTLVLVALIVAGTYYLLHKQKEDKLDGGGNEGCKDQLGKQASTLLDKLVDFQKELTLPYGKDKDGKYVYKKEYDKSECEKYEKLLYLLMANLEKTAIANDSDIKTLLSIETGKSTCAKVNHEEKPQNN